MKRFWIRPGKRLRLADDLNRFAWRLFDAIGGSSNLALSPSGIETALAMTHAGAGGRTREELRAALADTLADEALPKAFGDLLAATRSGGVELRSANRLWIQSGYQLFEEHLHETERHFGAGAAELDFAGDAEGARRTINAWIADQTAHRINDALPLGCIGPLARLVLTTAVYFLGKWESAFDEQDTQEGPFFSATGATHTLPFMHQVKHFVYAESDAFQLVELPYRRFQFAPGATGLHDLLRSGPEDGSSFVMTVILPRSGGSVDDVVRRLVTAGLSTLPRTESTRVRLFLPRFRIESEVPLRNALMSLGVHHTFSREADFTRMSANPEGLFLSEVLHKAFVDVNERGTEAAAATAGILLGAALGPTSPPKDFRADHPFLFLIRDAETGLVHFIGRYMGLGPS